ncbi:putative homogentisate phytyltransferase 1, chloroplastic [Cocos nucifera]|uniref:Putative homogentisate phytyltransferase 1, chloroplastic n=1 Tax=Cocos nucifera TaxID=13894 RepID=A0A8K0N652_COCNU|nr:putative homogentisate phytyltransferase 1, chloroplastic [Cocos nucifera]
MANQSEGLWAAVAKKLDAFYRFSRPHTVIGTIIGIVSVSLLPVQSIADFSPTYFMGLLKALVPAVCMNIYVVGLNQLFDIEIDKVNKPRLPLASGEFSLGTGIVLVLAAAIVVYVSDIHFAFASPFLGAEVVELKFKNRKLYNGVEVQVSSPIRCLAHQLFSWKCIFYQSVIALFKDIPDVDGDRYFGIQSFSVRLGQEKVVGHGLLASILWFRAQSIDLRNKASITSFYMFIWKPSHKTFRIKKKLAKKMRQNRPIPHWIRMRTDNTIRYNAKRRHWRRTKLGF